MKPLAIFLVILVIAALAGIGYLYFTSNITVSFVSVTATDPASQLDTFDQVKAAVGNDTFVGTRYSSAPLTGAEDYLFYTWTVHLENQSFLPADTIEIQVTPMAGDALLIGDTALHHQAGSRLANHLVGNHGTTQTLRVVVEQPNEVTHSFFMIGGHLACLCFDHKRALLLVQNVDEMPHRFVFA